MVAEADESDRSFLRGVPEVAVVTNVDPITTPPTAPCRSCVGVPLVPRAAAGGRDRRVVGASSGHACAGRRVLRFGIGPGSGSHLAADLAVPPFRYALRVDALRDPSRRRAARARRHNVLNALAALAAACRRAPTSSRPRCARPLPARRQTLRAPRGANGIRVFDDYAHHATEVEAQSQPHARSSPGGWSPSSSRTCTRARSTLHRDLGRALALADLVIVLDVYPARERPEGRLAGITGKFVADASADSAHGRQVWWLPTLQEAERVACRPRERGRPGPDARCRRRRHLAGRLLERLLALRAASFRAESNETFRSRPYDDPHRRACRLVRPPAGSLRSSRACCAGRRVADRRRSSGLGIESPGGRRRIRWTCLEAGRSLGTDRSTKVIAWSAAAAPACRGCRASRRAGLAGLEFGVSIPAPSAARCG